MESPGLGGIQIKPERLSQFNHDVAVGSVYTELLTGLASCRLLRNRQIIPKKRKAWHLCYAKRALHDAEVGMWKLKLSHPEFDQMMAIAERLRFELDSLQTE
jgi:hypothetical protein